MYQGLAMARVVSVGKVSEEDEIELPYTYISTK